MISDRAILTVLRHAGSWVVEHDGEHFGHSPDKEIAKASANKRARQMQDIHPVLPPEKSAYRHPVSGCRDVPPVGPTPHRSEAVRARP
jgi:hypothetical protein